MNFIWLDINASWSHSSLALPALHANLHEDTAARCNMKVVRGTVKTPVSQIVEEVAILEPTYIFATAWLFNIDYLASVLSRIGNLCSPSGIFLGGPEFLGNNEFFLRKNKYVSAVFKGEGEDIFEPFVSSLLNNDGKWKQLPGFERIEDGEYINGPAVVADNFTSLVFPSHSPLFSWDKSFVQVETSRGCFNTCRFCVSGIEKTAVTDIPANDLRAVFNTVVSRGIKQVRILDRTFNANPSRAMELLDLFVEFAGKLNFHLEIHPALLHVNDPDSDSPVALLRKKIASLPHGLLHLEAGIQTLRQDVLDKCARKGRCANALKGLEFLAGCKNFEVHADLIAGLPGYSYHSLVEDTLHLMDIGPAEIQLESLKLLPGTCFRKDAEAYGLKYSPVPPYEVLQTPSISYSELNKSMVLSRILDFWYNDSKWRIPFVRIFSQNIGLLMLMIDKLSETDFVSQPLGIEGKGLMLYEFCLEYSPENANYVALQWVRNGLSVKKKPAEKFCKWDIRSSSIANPLLVEGDARYKYFFIEVENRRFWFSFNKEIERIAPCGSCVEEI